MDKIVQYAQFLSKNKTHSDKLLVRMSLIWSECNIALSSACAAAE